MPQSSIFQQYFFWLVVWNMIFMTFHILGRIIPTYPNWLSYFSEGLKPLTSFVLVAPTWLVELYLNQLDDQVVLDFGFQSHCVIPRQVAKLPAK